MYGAVRDDVSLFAGINASLSQTSFIVPVDARIDIGVNSVAKPPVDFANVRLIRSDGEPISDAGNRINIEGSSIRFQDLKTSDSGDYTVQLMHPTGKVLEFTLEVCEFVSTAHTVRIAI